MKLALKEKLRSTLGTLRRVVARKLYQSLRLQLRDGIPVKPPMVGIEKIVMRIATAVDSLDVSHD